MATIQNDRDIALQASPYRLADTIVTITSTAGAFNTAKNGGATTPSSITLTSTTNSVFTGASINTWHYALNTTPTTWVSLGTGTTKSILNTDILSIIGTATSISYRCTTTETLLNTAYDYYTVSYIKEVSDPVVVNITRPSAVVSVDVDGTPFGFSNTDTIISVTRGSDIFNYAASGANTFSVTIQSNVGCTVGTTTGTGTTYTVAGITAMSADTAKIVFVVTVRDASGNTISPTYGKEIVYNKLYKGATGTTGNKSVTINAFKWSNSGAGTITQAFTYTWSSGAVSAYPTGYTAAAPASPGTGYTLYQLNLIITDVNAATTTATNWSGATTNSIGYRQDGSIGVTGNSARVAYVVNTSSTVPGAVTPGTGDVVPTSGAGTWSFSATSTLTAGQYMYQVDGILDSLTGNIAWGNPYLSNLKVGSLSALSADLGVVAISTTGSLASTGKTYGGSTAGFFLGYSSAAYKFDVGDSDNYLRWDGTVLTATGIVIKDVAGTTIIAAGSGLDFATRFAGTTNLPANNATVGADASNLTVGTGSGNFISNAGPYPGSIRDYVLGFNNTGKTPEALAASYDPWRPTGQGGVYLTFTAPNSPPISTVCDINNGNIRYPVVANARYEASAYISAHRCVAYIKIAWYDSTNAYIGESAGSNTNNTQTQGALVNWFRSVLFATAPSNAAMATVFVRSDYAGTSNPYTFASMWYFGSALAAQTTASPWSDGGSTTSLARSGADILTGPISLAASNAILVGTVNDGLYLGSSGIVGRKASATTFSIDSAGNAIFKGDITGANGTFGGNLHGGQFTTGNFTGYAWPSSGGTGSYLGPSGLLVGNANDGKYFQVEADGDIFAPNFSIVAGVMTISQANVINTLNLAGNSVSVINSATGTGTTVSTTLAVQANQTLHVIVLINLGPGPTLLTYPTSSTFSYSIDGTSQGSFSLPVLLGMTGGDNGETNYTNSSYTSVAKQDVAGGGSGRTVTISLTKPADTTGVVIAQGYYR